RVGIAADGRRWTCEYGRSARVKSERVRQQLAKKIRVYELARELGLTNKEALDLYVDLGIGVKSHSSSIEDAKADRARRKADALGIRREVQPEEPAPAKKGAKAATAATVAPAAPAPAVAEA